MFNCIKQHPLLLNLLRKIRNIVYAISYKLICVVVPCDRNKAIFSSFIGLSYSDNPRAISEEFYKRNPKMKIIWSFQNPKDKKNIVPSYVKCIKTNSIYEIFHLATASVWVDNYCKSLNTKKRDGQLYIQTWHGDRGFKKILADMQEDKDKFELFESRNCDVMVSGSKFGEAVYRSSFKYNGRLLKVGSPKNDFLLNPQFSEVEYFKEQYGIDEKYKLLLYAPTFRDSNMSNEQKVFGLDISVILDTLEKKTNMLWKCITRGHTGREILFENGNDRVISVSNYEDMKIVLLASDIIVSDYSSCVADYALLGRPIILYINDLKNYLENDRELWFDLHASPYWVVTNQNEFVNLIENLDLKKAEKNCQDILSFYKTYESGFASVEVCKYIENYLRKETIV